MKYIVTKSPVGTLTIAEWEGKLCQLRLNFDPPQTWQRVEALESSVVNQLNEYFQGLRETFDLELHMEGTIFQKEVWNCLQRLPYGTTTTYGQMAQDLGRPKAARAVGAANGANPIAIVVPCHRVIGAGGKLTGYAYGLDVKSTLLELENRITQS